MNQPVVIWGARGQARVVGECLQQAGVPILALFDNDADALSPFAGVPIFHGEDGFDRWLRGLTGAAVGAVVAIGGGRGRERVEIQRRLAQRGLPARSVFHHTASVSPSARLGVGAQVLAQAAVCAGVVMGEACIVNTGASVDHESILGDGVHVAPGARLAGCVTVGNHVFIGMGAVVLPRLRVGAAAIVGAGAVVTRDVPPGATVVGCPARVV